MLCYSIRNILGGLVEVKKTDLLVFGIGNILCADEGFGVRCVEALNALYEFGDNVTLMDGLKRFSVAAAQHGGMVFALLPAVFFMLGMMVTDAANGLWISHLLKRADATARTASRIMGVTVALLSLAVAGLGLSRHLLPQVAAWQEGRELILGVAVICMVVTAFLFARFWTRRVPVIA